MRKQRKGEVMAIERIEIVNFSQRFWLKVGDKAVAVSGHVRKVCEVTKICGTERVYVRTTAGEFNDNGRERRKGGNLRLEAYDEAREAEKAAEEANKQEASRAAMRDREHPRPIQRSAGTDRGDGERKNQ